MGRKVIKVQPKTRKTEWVFKVNIELTYNNKAKVAFLSGLQRSYYPEDPGFSKFGLVHGVNVDESPPCTLDPPVDKIGKPISHLGYGIGGLSAPRFATNPHDSAFHPSPDKYQPLLNQCKLKSRRKPVPPEEDYYQLSPSDPYLLRKRMEKVEQKLRQCKVGFGTLKRTARFGNPPRFNTPGVGCYRPEMRQTLPPRTNSSFGRSPVIFNPSADIRCSFEPSSVKCIECGRSLEIIDFYRTRLSVRVPLPETRHVSELEKDFPKGVTKVNLCNVCYFRAIRGNSKNWSTSKVRWLFRKARTCAMIHDHENLNQTIHKANCKTVRKLQRKEAVLSRYYRDTVAESIPRAEY